MLVTPAGHPSAQTPAAPGCSPRHGHPFAAGTEVQFDEEALCVQAWDSTLCPPAPGIRCIYIHACPIAGRRETATFQTDVCPRLLTLSSALMKPSILACMKLAMLLWKRTDTLRYGLNLLQQSDSHAAMVGDLHLPDS